MKSLNYGNLLRGIDMKTVRRERICLHANILFSVTLFLQGNTRFKLAFFFIHFFKLKWKKYHWICTLGPSIGPNQTSDTLQYKTLGQLDDHLIDQASDVSIIIFFHNFLQISLQKFFEFKFLQLYKKKQGVLSALSHCFIFHLSKYY